MLSAKNLESGKSGVVAYFESRILTHRTEEEILLILDGVEKHVENPIKGMFDVNVFYRNGN